VKKYVLLFTNCFCCCSYDFLPFSLHSRCWTAHGPINNLDDWQSMVYVLVWFLSLYLLILNCLFTQIAGSGFHLFGICWW
jgi:hypothetical protein